MMNGEPEKKRKCLYFLYWQKLHTTTVWSHEYSYHFLCFFLPHSILCCHMFTKYMQKPMIGKTTKLQNLGALGVCAANGWCGAHKFTHKNSAKKVQTRHTRPLFPFTHSCHLRPQHSQPKQKRRTHHVPVHVNNLRLMFMFSFRTNSHLRNDGDEEIEFPFRNAFSTVNRFLIGEHP